MSRVDLPGASTGVTAASLHRSLTAPTSAIRESMDRRYILVNTLAVLSTGALRMQSIGLVAGDVVTNIAVLSGTTAAGTPTHYMFGLYDSSRNLLATSTDQTTAAWGASTLKTLAMTTPYTVPTTGVYYIGIFVTATTVPTLQGSSSAPSSALGNASGMGPSIGGTTTDASLTTALPNPAAAITTTGFQFYAFVS